MLSKSSIGEQGYVHYIAKFTISRFVVLRFKVNLFTISWFEYTSIFWNVFYTNRASKSPTYTSIFQGPDLK